MINVEITERSIRLSAMLAENLQMVLIGHALQYRHLRAV